MKICIQINEEAASSCIATTDDTPEQRLVIINQALGELQVLKYEAQLEIHKIKLNNYIKKHSLKKL